MRTSWLMVWLQMIGAMLLAAPAARATPFEDALVSAYEHNPRIQAQRQTLKATDENVSIATSGFRPDAEATYVTGKQNTTINGGPEVRGDTTTKNVRVEQPLFRGGGTFSSLNSSRQMVKAGQYDLSAVEQQVLLDAVTVYMDVVSNASILELSRTNEHVLAEHLKAATTRFQVGDVTRTDVAQSQSRLSDAKSDMIASESQVLASMASFERVVGYRPVGTLAVPEKMPELPASLNEALEQGRSANPQLLSALHRAKSSLYDVRTNEAAILPTMSLVGTMSRQDGVGSLGANQFDQDRVTLEFSIPLYQSGAEYARVRQAKDVARSLDHQATDTRQAVEESITQGWAALENAIATITARTDQIKASELALEGVRQENQFGTRTLLDVLNAQQELFAARSNLVRAQRDRVVAAYALAFRLGQLTPQRIGLDQVTPYDPKIHAGETEWKPVGL